MMCKNYSNVRITCCEPIRAGGGGGVGGFDFPIQKRGCLTPCVGIEIRDFHVT